MRPSDHAPIIALAMLAARADGDPTPVEQAAIDDFITRIGSPDVSRLAEQVATRQLRVADLAGRLSDDEARRTAWETAMAVCHADGLANPAELAFLEELRQAARLTKEEVAAMTEAAAKIAGTPIEVGVKGAAGSAVPSEEGLDELILRQAILTGALEILPDRLANIAVLPLQLRLVYRIGKHYGQQMDANQVKDLAATLGLGAAAQAMEGVVLKVLGGVAGGLLGGLLGGATRVAAGAAVTFGTSYALGHVAKQYYAQGRRLSGEDLRALFARFRDEAKTIYPKVEAEVRGMAQAGNLRSLVSER